MVAQWSAPSVATAFVLGVFSVSDGTLNERIQMRRNNSTDRASFLASDGGVVQYNDLTSTPLGAVNKTALAYKINDFQSSVNSVLGTADTSGTLPTVDRAEIGAGQSIAYLNGHLRAIAYYPQRLPNATLQALTA